MAEKVRIIDIAESLGLSTATISNVLHGKTKKISDETVKRVQKVVEESGYIPNMAGILLAQNTSKIIGIMINNHEKYEKRVLQDPFVYTAVDYLSEAIEKADCFMMIKCTTKVSEVVKFASMWNMAGVVLIGFCDQDYQHLRGQIHIPFVVYDGFCKADWGYGNVAINDFDGGYQMGKYLLSMGHKEILFLADNTICMDEARYEGLKQAMQEEGIVDVPPICVLPMKKSERMAYYKMKLPDFRKYTALFAASDYYAIEMMAFLKAQGIAIPGEISVVGFDDIPESSQVTPALTTIRQDDKARAYEAITYLQEARLNPGKAGNWKLPVWLVRRKSVKNRLK